jgi:small subunit ribosomal protein S5
MRIKDRKQRRVKIRRRYRQAVRGTANRPRLSVYRSLRHVYAQIIDDDSGVTLASASTLEKSTAGSLKATGNREAGALLGKLIAERAKDHGVESVVFDRGGFRYHGVIRAIADGESEFAETVVHINRVAKVVKGGKNFSFSAVVVAGDGSGKVGFGTGKAREVPPAIQKASEQARKEMVKIPLVSGTVPHLVWGRWGATRVLLRPASPGTGVIAGGGVRAVMESAGVADVLTKIVGSRNPFNVVRATFDAIDRLMTSGQVQRLRGVDMQAPEASEVEDLPAETEISDEAEEPTEAAVAEGDDSR